MFIGQVVNEEHHWNGSANEKRVSASKSQITFKISQILQTPVEEPWLRDSEEISLVAFGCGEKYRMGHEYIVLASRDRKRASPEDPQLKTTYEAECHPVYGPYDTHEMDILRTLKQ